MMEEAEGGEGEGGEGGEGEGGGKGGKRKGEVMVKDALDVLSDGGTVLYFGTAGVDKVVLKPDWLFTVLTNVCYNTCELHSNLYLR